jgi:hypothetical protein
MLFRPSRYRRYPIISDSQTESNAGAFSFYENGDRHKKLAHKNVKLIQNSLIK